MMWDWSGSSWWWWFVMSGGMVLFWGFVAWVVLQAARSDRASADGSEAILAARFARGEIDAEEYRQRLEVLRLGPGRRASRTDGADH